MEIKDDKIIIGNKEFYLDYYEEKDRRIVIDYKWDGFCGI